MRILLILCLFASQVLYAQVNLSQGLIAYYPFSGNANDASGNNINGTVNGATLTTDKAGNANSAYYFNGTSANILLPFSSLYNFAPQDSFSISVWVLPDQGYSWPAQAVVVKAPPHPDFTLSAWNYGSYIYNYKGMSGYAYNHILNGTTTFTNDPCWYNIITTYKNGIWKMYINGVLESQDLSQTKFILQDGTSRIAFGKKGESNGDYYKGKMDEVRIYNRVLNQAEAIAITGNCLLPCPQPNDFSFTRDPCNPLTVTFQTNATGYNSIRWEFGDGAFLTGQPNSSNTYANPGSYQVMLITTYPNCADTVKKTLDVSVLNDPQLVQTNDTTICTGTTKQLLAGQALQYCWTPTATLSNPAIANPIASPTQTTTYYLVAEYMGANLIINGDFNAGNTGFTSSYLFANPNVTEGQYFVGTNPQAWNASLSPCVDHTGGSGNMMMVNGSPTANVEVWKQTVTVTPNTNYVFATWIQALWPPNPAQLQFSINGRDIGSMITASLPTCTWTRFYTVWNSGNAVSATISIVNKNTQITGNDFALDDISFAALTMRRDSVKVNLSSLSVTTSNNTTICEGNSVQLNTAGAAIYSWSPSTGLSNASIANPVASPTVTTQYIVTGTNSNNCTGKDTVVITVNPKPVVTVSRDTTICPGGSAQLQATGGSGYSWSPATGLSNPAIANPLANPAATTTYTVTVTDNQNCQNTASVKVDLRANPSFTVSPSAGACSGQPVQLIAGGGDTYVWSPATGLNNTSLPNPVASPAATTTYQVLIRDTICGNSRTLNTTVNVYPLPLVKAFKSNDIDCTQPSAQLNATGAVRYAWAPAATLSNPGIMNPVATPTSATQYLVTGTDANGCVNTDVVTVDVTGANRSGYLMPTAFTPNNDGLNDCYGVKYWGVVSEIEFSIFNRWGQRVFHTTTPGACWDGTYKGIPQDPAVFVYMIRAKNNCDGNIFRKGTFTLIR